MPRWPWNSAQNNSSREEVETTMHAVMAMIRTEFSPKDTEEWGRIVQSNAAQMLTPSAFGYLDYMERSERQKGTPKEIDFAARIAHVAKFLAWARDKGVSAAVVLEKQYREQLAEAVSAFIGSAAVNAPSVLRQYQSVLLTPFGILMAKLVTAKVADADDRSDPAVAFRRLERGLRMQLLETAQTSGIATAEKQYVSAVGEAMGAQLIRMKNDNLPQ